MIKILRIRKIEKKDLFKNMSNISETEKDKFLEYLE